MKKILSLIVVSVLALTLSACGGNEKTIKIGVVLPDATEERWANQDGEFFKKELDALGEGYEYEILFSEGSDEKELQNVESLIAKGIEVLIITVDGSGAGAVQAAKDAGVTVIAHDRMAKKNADIIADYYTTFNSWNVGKAMGQHLVDEAEANGCTAADKCDLALFAGRTSDWPNATYFFGGAMEVIQPKLSMFNIINVGDVASKANALDLYTEATFNDAAKTALQDVMAGIDTDWNPQTAGEKASAVVATIASVDKSSEDVYVLAPNDDTSAAIRQEFAQMTNPYANYYTTGQDASNVALASLMGDVVYGKGTQTMTVFKDTSKLVKDSVAIAKNVVDGKDGLTGLTGGPKIDDVDTAYTAIDVLTSDEPQKTYDLIFVTGYKNKEDSTFGNIDFSVYE